MKAKKRYDEDDYCQLFPKVGNLCKEFREEKPTENQKYVQ